MVASALRRIDFRLQLSIDWHDPRVRQVFVLMLPVTIGLGIVNLDQLLNSVFGTLVSSQAPRAIDNAFRIYMLPAGDLQRRGGHGAVPDAQPSGGPARRGRHAPRGRQRDAPDQPPVDPRRRAADGAGDADHPTGLPARRVRRALDASRLGRAVLVRLQPSFRRRQPAAHADVLRGQATMDSHRAGGPEHGRRHHRQHCPVQAAGDRRAGDRHGRGQRGDDRPPAPAAAEPASTAAWRARRR